MPFDPSKVQALLFDVDGTLADTDDAYIARAAKLLRPAEFLFPNRDPRPFLRWGVMTSESPLNTLMGLPDFLGIDDELVAFTNWLSDVRGHKPAERFAIMAGVAPMLERLSQRYPPAVVTARSERSINTFLEQFNLRPYFKAVASAQTAAHTKPYPDPVQWAAVFKVPDDGPPGLWRAAFPSSEDESEQSLLDAANVERQMQGLVAKPEPYDIRYKSIYRVHQRVAKDFRHGRVLLAGDAAHLNNPVGGFGLNSGIHDAVNLTEKLARVCKGEADDTLLDRYVRQRRAVCVEEVQRISIRNKRLLEERDPAVQRQRLTELVAIANDPERARKHMLDTSMISGVRKAAEIE